MGLNALHSTHTLGYFGVLVYLIQGIWTEDSFHRYTYCQCEAVNAAAVRQYTVERLSGNEQQVSSQILIRELRD